MSAAAMVTDATLRGQVRPGCESDPDGWDMDRGELADWLRAIRTCTTECPLLRECIAARRELYRGENPAGVIWGGTAYTATGEPLKPLGLVEYASAGNRRRRAARRVQAA